MKFPHFLTILLLFALPVLISCATKQPETDSQETQAYNLEDLPLSDNLVKHIKNGDEQKYVIYTFYNVGDKNKIHKQYWQGIIVFDDLPLTDQALETTDNMGNKIVEWRTDSFRKSHSRDVYNVNGALFRRTTINPDGSAVDSVDLNGDGRADYTEASLPNGDELIVVSDPLGMKFLDEFLNDRLSLCNSSEMLGVPRNEIPGCRDSGGPGEIGSGAGIGPADMGNPYDQFMESICEGYEIGGASSLPGATHSRNLTNVERLHSWRRIQDRNHMNTTVTEYYDDDSSVIFDTQFVVEDDGSSHFITTKTVMNPDGTSTSHTRGTATFADGSTRTSQSSAVNNTDGTSTQRGSSVTRRRDGSTTTRHWRTTTRSDGSSTTREWERTDRADGTSSATPVTETECASDGSCSEPVPAPDPGSDTEDPGFEADPDAAMAEFCDIWRQSQEDRPNDVSELNERANEERCSIEPDESGATEGSSLAETCYFDIQGRDELAEFIAGGACVTASGGTHFDYDSGGTARCTQNRFFILERGLILNGASGLSAAELCEEDLACDPADF